MNRNTALGATDSTHEEIVKVKVGNIKAYLRATIFNCTTTLECYSDMTVQNLLAETYYA